MKKLATITCTDGDTIEIDLYDVAEYLISFKNIKPEIHQSLWHLSRLQPDNIPDWLERFLKKFAALTQVSSHIINELWDKETNPIISDNDIIELISFAYYPNINNLELADVPKSHPPIAYTGDINYYGCIWDDDDIRSHFKY